MAVCQRPSLNESFQGQARVGPPTTVLDNGLARSLPSGATSSSAEHCFRADLYKEHNEVWGSWGIMGGCASLGCWLRTVSTRTFLMFLG